MTSDLVADLENSFSSTAPALSVLALFFTGNAKHTATGKAGYLAPPRQLSRSSARIVGLV
jgi:hypothetical protein